MTPSHTSQATPQNPDGPRASRPTLSRITIYPVKALDGLDLREVEIGPEGALVGDRRFAMFDAAGKFVHGKRTPKVHLLRTTFSGDLSKISLRRPGDTSESTFALSPGNGELSVFLSAWFGFPVSLRENLAHGFPDDLDAPGPTVICESTIAAVADWFTPASAAPEETGEGHISPDNMAARLRANLLVSGSPAFAEDALVPKAGSEKVFRIGAVDVAATGACARCIVPTRDPFTGEAQRGFQRRFMEQRKITLPAGTEVSRFDHYFRLSLNTRIHRPFRGKILRVGDPVHWHA